VTKDFAAIYARADAARDLADELRRFTERFEDDEEMESVFAHIFALCSQLDVLASDG
jgi:hypothetical protein